VKYLQTILASLILLVAVSGCSQHGDLPTELDLVPAPAVTIDDIQDNSDGTYRVTFSVADDTAVQYYRVYLLNPLTGQMELVGTVSGTNEAGIDLQSGQSISDYPFGISAVTVENVEGAMTVGLTP
jgi:hypothetical protein